MERTKTSNYLAWGLSGILAAGTTGIITSSILVSNRVGSEEGYWLGYERGYKLGRKDQGEIDRMILETAKKCILSRPSERRDEFARRTHFLFDLADVMNGLKNPVSGEIFQDIYDEMKVVHNEADKSGSL